MSILFVSDIHLRNDKPYITECFLHFLYYRAINAKALYILGDLFETWIGDDDPNPLHIKIAHALKYLHKNNVSCYFVHGNHDFLLGKQYANISGMTLLANQKTLNCFGYRIIILHGDTLCINDKNYKIFRKYTRKTWIKKCFLSLPIPIRLYISKKIQKNSARNYKNIISKINQKEVTNVLFKENADIVIHGHLHQAKIHYKIINNVKILERIALGTWKNTGSVIKINENGIRLTEFSFKKMHEDILN